MAVKKKKERKKESKKEKKAHADERAGYGNDSEVTWSFQSNNESNAHRTKPPPPGRFLC